MPRTRIVRNFTDGTTGLHIILNKDEPESLLYALEEALVMANLRYTPVRSGRLRSSFQTRRGSRRTMDALWETSYAVYVQVRGRSAGFVQRVYRAALRVARRMRTRPTRPSIRLASQIILGIN